MFHVKSTQNLQKLAFYQLLFKTQETLREATVKANMSGACVSKVTLGAVCVCALVHARVPERQRNHSQTQILSWYLNGRSEILKYSVRMTIIAK